MSSSVLLVVVRDAADVSLAIATAMAFLLSVVFVRHKGRKPNRDRRPSEQPRWLDWLLDRKALMTIITLLFLFVGLGLSMWKNHLADGLSFGTHFGPETTQMPMPTPTAFMLEMEEAPPEKQRGVATPHFTAAQPLFDSRDYKDAIPELQASIEAWPTQSAYLDLGIALRFTADFEAAAAALTKGLALAKEAKNRRFEANFLLQLGAVGNSGSHPVEAKPDLEKAEAIFRELGDKVGQADALLSLASLYRKAGRQREALALSAEAAPLYRGSANVVGMANVELYQGVDRVRAGDCKGALKPFEQALARFTEIGHLAGQARVRIAIGGCLELLHNTAEAVKELQVARELAVESGHKEVQGAAIIFLAQFLSRERKFADARQVAEEALGLGMEAEAPSVPLYAHIVVADADLNLGDLDGALSHVNEAVKLADQTTDADGRFNAACLKGRILLRRGQPAMALALLRQVVEAIGNTPPSLLAKVDCLQAFADALAATGNERESRVVRAEAEQMLHGQAAAGAGDVPAAPGGHTRGGG